MYTEHGQRMTEKLWKETLEELEIDDIERAVVGKK